jgi:hypothetical protein
LDLEASQGLIEIRIDSEKGVEEMGRGDSMEVVKRGNVAQWVSGLAG